MCATFSPNSKLMVFLCLLPNNPPLVPLKMGFFPHFFINPGESPVTSSVLQRSVPRTSFFCFFINDIPLCVNSSSCRLYADDALLGTDITHSREFALQNNVNARYEWFLKSGMTFNASVFICSWVKTDPILLYIWLALRSQKKQYQIPRLIYSKWPELASPYIRNN